MSVMWRVMSKNDCGRESTTKMRIFDWVVVSDSECRGIQSETNLKLSFLPIGYSILLDFFV